MRIQVLRAVCALAIVGCIAAGAAPPARADAEADARLVEMNEAFRAAYVQNRTLRLAATNPVLVVAFDDLILLRDGKETKETFTPPVYHRVKAMAHIPLGVVVILGAALDLPGDTGWQAQLAAFREQVQAAPPLLDRLDFTPEQLARQREIVERSLAFMDGVIDAGRVERDALTAYARAMRPLVMANSYDAAGAQLDGLHALAQRWRAEMGEAAWDRLYVLVLGPKLPRQDNVQFEYFARAMGRDAVGRRLLYTEGIFDKDTALSLLGSVVQDRPAAALFFDDPMRLDRDLLGDDGRTHLDRIFGPAAR